MAEDRIDDRTPLMQHTDETGGVDDVGAVSLGFKPSGSSTPRYTRHNTPGNDIEMQPLRKEGLSFSNPSYVEETDFGGTSSTEDIERRLASLRNSRTGLFDLTAIELQNAILSSLDKEQQSLTQRLLPRGHRWGYSQLRYSSKKLNQIVAIGPQGGETKVVRDDGTGLLADFLKKGYVKKYLGHTAEEVKARKKDELRAKEKERKAAEKSLKQAKADATEIEKQEKSLLEIRRKAAEAEERHGAGPAMEK